MTSRARSTTSIPTRPERWSMPRWQHRRHSTNATALVAAYGIGAIEGAELHVSVGQDPTFGPVITVTVGGPAAALIDDRASSITPLNEVDARDLVWSLRTAPQLFSSVDIGPLVDLLLRVSRLVDDIHELHSLDLDVATGAAHATLAPALPQPDLALRRLR
jgi:hypothetical protein